MTKAPFSIQGKNVSTMFLTLPRETHSNAEKLVSHKARVPSLEETNTGTYGRGIKKIHDRTLWIYGAGCFIGMLLWGLGNFSPIPIPQKIIALGCGFLIPGGGFLATGHIAFIIIGASLTVLFFTLGFKMLDMFGNTFVCVLIWLIGGLGGLFSGKATLVWAPLPAVGAALISWGYWAWQTNKVFRFLRASKTNRRNSAAPLIAHTERVYKQEEAFEERELDREGVEASRYIFDLCLAGKGLANFDRPFYLSSISAIRYQLANLGNTLQIMQCKYTPNFHGYLNKAQRFLIEGFTHPDVCGYWKYENLGGYWNWNPDPIRWANVMLSGWAAPTIISYAANTGDDRYEKPGAIKFHPMRHGDKTYDYSAEDFVHIFVEQIRKMPLALIPCEPFIQFPICNSYAILGLLIYDRYHKTHYTEEIYGRFCESIEQNFTDMNGDMIMRRNQLTGLRFTPKNALMGGVMSNIMSYAYHPIMPGYALRSFALLRGEAFYLEDGIAYIRGQKWEDMIDMSTKIKTPAGMIGQFEQLCLEFGDYEMARGFREVQHKYLVKSNERFKYQYASINAMAGIIAARWSKKNDWYDTILKGPPISAFTGPVLEECSYPDVLVAKAVSRGDDLVLVLYNGTDKKNQKLNFSRLQKDGSYRVEETGQRFKADAEGTAEILVALNNRTPLTIVPISA
jgi:hypothetical protein